MSLPLPKFESIGQKLNNSQTNPLKKSSFILNTVLVNSGTVHHAKNRKLDMRNNIANTTLVYT